METIKGKPELVRNSRPAPRPSPPAVLLAERERVGRKWASCLDRLSLQARCLPDPRLLGEGAPTRALSDGAWQPRAGRRARLDPPMAFELKGT